MLLLVVLLSSCGTFTEEVWINADGSGRYAMDYDASESLAMLEMMGGMDIGGEEEDEVDYEEDEAGDDAIVVEEEISDDPEDVLKDAFTKREKFDTAFNLMSIMPDSLRRIVTDKKSLRKAFSDRGETISDAGLDSIQNAIDLMDELDVAMRMDKSEGVLGFGMSLNFDNISKVAETFESMSSVRTLNDSDQSQAQAGGMADKMNNRTSFEMVGKNKLIVRQAPTSKIDELLGSSGGSADGLESDQIEGMLDMMGLGSYKVRVHVPGIVKSVSGGDYVIENDNTVVFTIDYMGPMKGAELMEAEINFKPKKKMGITVPK